MLGAFDWTDLFTDSFVVLVCKAMFMCQVRFMQALSEWTEWGNEDIRHALMTHFHTAL